MLTIDYGDSSHKSSYTLGILAYNGILRLKLTFSDAINFKLRNLTCNGKFVTFLAFESPLLTACSICVYVEVVWSRSRHNLFNLTACRTVIRVWRGWRSPWTLERVLREVGGEDVTWRRRTFGDRSASNGRASLATCLPLWIILPYSPESPSLPTSRSPNSRIFEDRSNSYILSQKYKTTFLKVLLKKHLKERVK